MALGGGGSDLHLRTLPVVYTPTYHITTRHPPHTYTQTQNYTNTLRCAFTTPYPFSQHTWCFVDMFSNTHDQINIINDSKQYVYY